MSGEALTQIGRWCEFLATLLLFPRAALFWLLGLGVPFAIWPVLYFEKYRVIPRKRRLPLRVQA